MNQYAATFHTHLAALRSCRALTAHGVRARMAPVPRSLSSSCGTCVLFESDTPQKERMDRDLEGIYLQTEQGYLLAEIGSAD